MISSICIGNDIYITPILHKDDEFWVFDYDRINEYIKQYGEIVVGMKMDWFFTARTINHLFPTNEEFFSLRFPIQPKQVRKYINGGLFDNDEAPEEVCKLYWNRKKKCEKMKKPFRISGLIGSRWDAPCVELPNETQVDCYIKTKIVVDEQNEVFWYEPIR
jgi:hypothetical protein